MNNQQVINERIAKELHLLKEEIRKQRTALERENEDEIGEIPVYFVLAGALVVFAWGVALGFVL